MAGLSEQAEEGTCKSPRVGVLLPKEQGDDEKTEEAPDQTTASPLYRFLAGQPLGFRNADNPELHVRRPPSACLGLASRFTSRASAHPAAVLSRHITLPLPIKDDVAGCPGLGRRCPACLTQQLRP